MGSHQGGKEDLEVAQTATIKKRADSLIRSLKAQGGMVSRANLRKDWYGLPWAVDQS